MHPPRALTAAILMALGTLMLAIGVSEAAGPAADAQELPLFDDGSVVRVPVTVLGQTRFFAVDTGGIFSVLDARFAKELGPAIQEADASEALTATSRLAAYKSPDLVVGATHANLDWIVCVDLSRFRAVTGEPCDGILGMDFLQRYAVSLDFDGQRFQFGTRVPDDVKAQSWTVPLKRVDQRRVGVEALINGAFRMDLMIDSADSASVSLQRRVGEGLFTKGAKMAAVRTSTLEAEAALVLTARLQTVQVGGKTYGGLLCNLTPTEGVPSSLGLAFLRRHRVAFDFPNQVLYLSPSSHFAEEDAADMSGLHLLRLEGKTVVHSVDAGSPAQRAGMQAGDVIESIDGKAAAALKMKEARQIFRSADGAKVRVRVRRKDAPREVTLVLKKTI